MAPAVRNKNQRLSALNRKDLKRCSTGSGPYPSSLRSGPGRLGRGLCGSLRLRSARRHRWELRDRQRGYGRRRRIERRREGDPAGGAGRPNTLVLYSQEGCHAQREHKERTSSAQVNRIGLRKATVHVRLPRFDGGGSWRFEDGGGANKSTFAWGEVCPVEAFPLEEALCRRLRVCPSSVNPPEVTNCGGSCSAEQATTIGD